MTSSQILDQLKSLTNESAKKMLLKHGAREPFYGVKIDDLKKILKVVKENRQVIAMELYASGIGDAQYLAALMADGGLMTSKQLQKWVETAGWSMISESSVPWVTAENKEGWSLAVKWIDSSKEEIAAAGWSTLSAIISTWPDDALDMKLIRKLLTRIEEEIDESTNRVRYNMNSFVISVGAYVNDVHEAAIKTGKQIGVVEVDMGGTACKVPFAPDYIAKAVGRGSLSKKKKTAKC